IFYSMLPSVATEVLPPHNEKLVITSYDKTFGGGPLTRHPRPDTHFNFPAFVKGYSNGTEYAEKVDLITYAQQAGPVSIKGSNSYGITENSYDTPLTISKPQTDVEMKVFGATSGMLLLTLPPGERERKHLRIAIYPNLNPRGGSANVVDAGRALICGKLKVSPLLDDNDSPQLRNVNNILINAAAADIFDRLGNAEMAKKYQEKAAAQTEIFIKAETNQNAYQPKIVPYTENYRRCGRRLF
ncbi:MAG TPA: hypothetical protein VFK03_02555, partial [Candidatus Saccharimonadales bacterium]|nr:hypothetical protein [Candidatus Saccharimonadales bacterium]